MIEGINKATATSKLGKAKPVGVHANNHGNTKLTNTELASNIPYLFLTFADVKIRFYRVGTSLTSLVFDLPLCLVLVSLKILSSPVNVCELPGSFSSVGI